MGNLCSKGPDVVERPPADLKLASAPSERDEILGQIDKYFQDHRSADFIEVSIPKTLLTQSFKQPASKQVPEKPG